MVVMGVTGCGKSTVGAAIAECLGVPFLDGDDLHPASNIAKMAQAIALTDDDRWPWLAAVGEALASHPDGAVVACSALKRDYRDAIRQRCPDVMLVHLAAPQPVLEERVRLRAELEGHFAGPGLLDSQFAILEPPTADERAVSIDVTTPDIDLAVGQACALVLDQS